MTDGLETNLSSRFSAIVRASTLSLRMISKRAGVAHATIGDWKLGRSLPQSFEELIKVVRVCITAAVENGQILTANERNESVWYEMWEDAKQVRDNSGSRLPEGLLEEVNMPALKLLANLDLYLDNIGTLEDQLALIPERVGLLINVTCRLLAERFVEKHNLRNMEGLPSDSEDNVIDILDLFLKFAWERGYFMYKIHHFDHVPAPARVINTAAIKVIAETIRAGDPVRDIEITIQRAVSLSSQPGVVKATMQYLSDPFVVGKLEEHLDDWCSTVRYALGQGVLAARAEVALPPSV
ncbi:hypothetical protein ACFVYA_37740 [Amycolatopsis sp. NPDC058278]|uniref:hypothetical protein n=1 Tax=Amycolatopsis sp. NPDC058278 TaxID=3346417 RepID=UPI0036DA59F9